MITMTESTLTFVLQIAAAAALIGTFYVNYLAQKLPINGLTQRDISESLPNLFTPAGLTFSIWGIIYLMLAVFSVFQIGLGAQTPNADLLNPVRVIFIINALANMAWLYVWHYRKFKLSLAVMGVLLVTLIFIHLELDKLTLTSFENIVFRLPFSLYFGWITVAAVVNVTALLVNRGWKRLGLSQEIWALIMLAVAAAIGTATIIIRQDIAYGLVFIWAYLGILIKHRSPEGFAKKYPTVIRAVMVCLSVFTVAVVLIIFKVV